MSPAFWTLSGTYFFRCKFHEKSTVNSEQMVHPSIAELHLEPEENFIPKSLCPGGHWKHVTRKKETKYRRQNPEEQKVENACRVLWIAETYAITYAGPPAWTQP
ncbi:hypothetical protein CapIbe_001105 [Capra ibex]